MPPLNSSPLPDYTKLLRFLMHPFLDSPDALRIDCEERADRSRVWVRLAVESADKGRVFGRGGRNLQAIRTVIEGVAKASGQSVTIDIFGGQPTEDHAAPERESRPPTPRTTPTPKPRPKPQA